MSAWELIVRVGALASICSMLGYIAHERGQDPVAWGRFGAIYGVCTVGGFALAPLLADPDAGAASFTGAYAFIGDALGTAGAVVLACAMPERSTGFFDDQDGDDRSD